MSNQPSQITNADASEEDFDARDLFQALVLLDVAHEKLHNMNLLSTGPEILETLGTLIDNLEAIHDQRVSVEMAGAPKVTLH